MDNTRKRSHSPDDSDERKGGKTVPSVQIATNPNAQPTIVQEQSPRAEDRPPEVNIIPGTTVMHNTRKRRRFPDGSDERGDGKTSPSVHTGTGQNTHSASVQKQSPDAKDQPLAVDIFQKTTVMDNTRKRSRSDDGSDGKTALSMQIATCPDTQSNSLQKQSPDAEDHPPAVDIVQGTTVMNNTRKRRHSPDASDEREGGRIPSSVQTGTDPDTSVKELSPAADQPSAIDVPAEIACPICVGESHRQGHFKCLPCSHALHQSCFDKWLNSNRSCPLCRFHIPRRRKKRPRRSRRPRAQTRLLDR